MDSHNISDWVTRQDKIDRVAKPTQEAIAAIYGRETKTAGAIENFLHGRWLGHPLHAALVHVPVGAWSLAAVLDIFSHAAGARAAADWAIAVGLVVAIPAMLTGSADWYPYTSDSIRRIVFVHMFANVCAFILYAMSYAIRGGNHLFAGLFTGYLGFACLIVSGYLGGIMVYEKKVGVNHAPESEDDAAPDDFVTVMKFRDLPENKPTKIQVGDVFAVLVNTGGRLFAMAEKCSHEGGPLSEGDLIDGCIACPWHQTVFRLEDGQVMSGPGVYAQAVFEVYIKDGDIRVKAIRAENPLIASTPVTQNISLM